MLVADARFETDYERSDVPPRLLVALAAGLGSAVAIVLIVLSFAFPVAMRATPRGPLRPLPPAPRLEVAPEAQLQHYKAAEGTKLHGYAILPDGHVQVPIDEAMRAVAAQGWSQPK